MPIESIDFGASYAVALSKNRDVYIWGQSSVNIAANPLPSIVTSLERNNIIQVKSGKYHILALTANGKLLTWGCGLHGQLGLNEKEDKSTPWLINKLYDHKITSISCGAFHSLALSDQNKLFSWGDNTKFSCGREADKRELLSPGEIYVPLSHNNYEIAHLFSNGLSSGILLHNLSNDVPNVTPRIRYERVPAKDGKRLKVLVASWNINAQSSIDIQSWLLGDVSADIIAIGFQELIELSSHSVAQDEAKSKIVKANLVSDNICKYWSKLLLSSLNSGNPGKYVLLKDVRLAGVYLSVFLKKELQVTVLKTKSNVTKVGVLGKLVSENQIFLFLSKFNNTLIIKIKVYIKKPKNNHYILILQIPFFGKV